MKTNEAEQRIKTYKAFTTLHRRKVRRELQSLVAHVLLEYAPGMMQASNWHWSLAKKIVSGIGI